ncbi:hypothetical protein PF005_g23008 [Phytophthora fragariae]|uniref:Uncharacterized protein n=1 Tax=Phytophthora fragariae TaxID=53985 RepID=A0A6A3W8P1_9STRA|nr:hypothetical protein PF009_g24231 [Phytophthora fragariae]KAE8981441.1 hypothetical protein PF011_g22017 [Phytophthora fragariae]KAE9181093.1 hypothetical protein PF005_g23008 [Phytophthora fragariae]KAE9284396.1 hypothetical protein PF001_g22402 [Phytophthora fragariae]
MLCRQYTHSCDTSRVHTRVTRVVSTLNEAAAISTVPVSSTNDRTIECSSGSFKVRFNGIIVLCGIVKLPDGKFLESNEIPANCLGVFVS